MLTFRRALVAAALILTILFFTTRSTPPATALEQFPQAKNFEGSRQASTTAAGTNPIHGPPGRHRPAKSGQQTIQDLSKLSLQDKLAYQFPYDVESKFPAYIWQTWKWTPAHSEFDFREQEATWTEQHPGFVHEVITDQVAVHLLRLLYGSVPEVLEAYDALPLPVLKADFFRYLILLARGGIYSDIDTYAIRSALEWIPESVPRDAVGLVIGIEADPDRPDWKDWYSRRIQFCQWTIQSKPGHPILREIVKQITDQTLKRKRAGSLRDVNDKSVIEFTGPALWTDIIFSYFNDERYFDMSSSPGPIDWKNFTGMEVAKRVGDVVVLPITSFSPGVQQMGAKDYDDPMAFVKHDFEGNLSISEGPTEPRVLEHTIPAHFASVVSQYGDHAAVIARTPTTGKDVLPGIVGEPPAAVETRLSYEGLDLVSNTLARSLRSLGVGKGDRVAVSLGNSAEFAALTYAIFKLGAILVPLNPGFNAKQVTAALNHLGVRLLIIGAVTDLAYKPCRGRSNLALLEAIVPDLYKTKVESPSVPTLERVVIVDNSASHPLSGFPRVADLRALTPFTELLPDFEPRRSSPSARSITPDSPLDPAETINIQFTSGTTSHPKAAMLSHTSILNNGYLIGNRMGLTPSDKIVCPPPLFHCFGSVLGYMATATSGAAILFPSPAFDPLASLRMVASHQATGLYGVATMFGIAAGSSVPESLMRRLYQTLGLEELVICYGMTETSPVSCMTSPHDSFIQRTRTVGRVMPHTRVKVVDPHDRTRILPRGEKGELAAAGYLVMKGYWGDEERTSEVRIQEPDGTVWMYSGDEAAMDADGYVEITGRIKDLIIRGGENIHPLEIENCLFQHPLIAEASVVGVPDERYGECVGAFVIVHKGVEAVEGEGGEQTLVEGVGRGAGTGKKVLTKGEVREWVGTHLSRHLVPKHVFWVDEYPKTASGKIQKFKLREVARKILGGEEGSS
ncbi:hypothetical protein QBC47DRAFT_426243 [Echria macrotheca]|uniref:Uncharacterized protein n=1 Tax=Echria macrotheca TaxID=438768 RepID=A0AAJ0B1Z4_9PEZI|nr:hypothetical protein QBC47DRAFT_426243 [Echria macrotheca]